MSTPEPPGVELLELPIHRDSRGHFSTSFSLTGPERQAARFPIAQVSRSLSAAGVVRGLHFTRTPPGCAKIVRCSVGRVRDVIVDIRHGSPSFAEAVEVELDAEDGRILVLPVGVAHGFAALEDDTVVEYLLSAPYRPENELALDFADPQLKPRLDWHEGATVSERDRQAPSLATLDAEELLPNFSTSRALDEELLYRLKASTPGL